MMNFYLAYGSACWAETYKVVRPISDNKIFIAHTSQLSLILLYIKCVAYNIDISHRHNMFIV
jgi:hypothetical protein